jgi:hypothetical protein
MKCAKTAQSNNTANYPSNDLRLSTLKHVYFHLSIIQLSIRMTLEVNYFPSKGGDGGDV